MLKVLGLINQVFNDEIEDDKEKMKILKSHRRGILVVIIFGMIIDIHDIFSKEATFISGLITGVVGVTAIIGLITNYRLSKRIRIRINKNID